MKVKEFKNILNNLPDDGEIMGEDKITGDELPFELIMSVWTYDNNLVIGLK